MTPNHTLATAYLNERPVEAARVLEKLPVLDSSAYLATAPTVATARVMELLMPWFAAQCLETMPEEPAANILQALPSYRAALLLRSIKSPAKDAILRSFHKSKSKTVRKQMAYPKDTIGAWVDTFVPCVPEETTVEESLIHARSLWNRLSQHLCVVTREGVLLGGVSLSRLISADNNQHVTDLLDPEYVALPVQASLTSVKWHDGWNQFSLLPAVNVRNQVEGMISYEKLREALGEVENQEFAVESFLSGLVPVYTTCLTLFAHALTSIPYNPVKREKAKHER